MSKPSRREHELALAAAIAVGKAEIESETTNRKKKGEHFFPTEGIEYVEEAYLHALETFTGKYPD